MKGSLTADTIGVIIGITLGGAAGYGLLRGRAAWRRLSGLGWRVEVDHLPPQTTAEGIVGSRVAIVLRRAGQATSHTIALLDPSDPDFDHQLHTHIRHAKRRARLLDNTPHANDRPSDLSWWA